MQPEAWLVDGFLFYVLHSFWDKILFLDNVICKKKKDK